MKFVQILETAGIARCWTPLKRFTPTLYIINYEILWLMIMVMIEASKYNKCMYASMMNADWLKATWAKHKLGSSISKNRSKWRKRLCIMYDLNVALLVFNWFCFKPDCKTEFSFDRLAFNQWVQRFFSPTDSVPIIADLDGGCCKWSWMSNHSLLLLWRGSEHPSSWLTVRPANHNIIKRLGSLLT